MFSSEFKEKLSAFKMQSKTTKSFEELNQNSGFLLYETRVPKTNEDPTIFLAENIKDRAHVFIDQNLIGILSRENKINSLPITLGWGNELQIFVENQGRINYMVPKDNKGLLGHVHYGDVHLENFTITGFPFDDYSQIRKLIKETNFRRAEKTFSIDNGPVLLYAEFNLNENDIFDTYLDPRGWGKVRIPLMNNIEIDSIKIFRVLCL